MTSLSLLASRTVSSQRARKIVKAHKTQSLRVGFEPTREFPIGFQVQSLNHSAIAADAATHQTNSGGPILYFYWGGRGVVEQNHRKQDGRIEVTVPIHKNKIIYILISTKNASLIITDFSAMIYKKKQPRRPTASLCRGWAILENDFNLICR